ncbi:flavoprotein [Streptomyces sp. NPDC050856]|uniref:flavoprotein n=1 Tax=Streptomyces sp. NPDC050856 TaxID=3154939 RepID=UPI0033D7B649
MTEQQTPPPRILVGAAGSVSVTMLPTYLNEMRSQLGGTYTVLMTHTAAQFLPPHTVGIYAERVVSGESPSDWPTDKPSLLVADHDILVVLPATANTLSAAATGAAPNRLSTIVLASNFPVVFFPVMGSHMWNKPAVKRNIAQIREDGHHVADPVWHDSFDVVSRGFTHHPSLPSPTQVAEIVGELLSKHRSA